MGHSPSDPSRPRRTVASTLADVSAIAGGTGTFAAPVGNGTAPGQGAIIGDTTHPGDGAIDTFTGSPTRTAATRTFDDGVFLAGSLAVNGLNVAPLGLTGNDGDIGKVQAFLNEV